MSKQHERESRNMRRRRLQGLVVADNIKDRYARSREGSRPGLSPLSSTPEAGIWFQNDLNDKLLERSTWRKGVRQNIGWEPLGQAKRHIPPKYSEFQPHCRWNIFRYVFFGARLTQVVSRHHIRSFPGSVWHLSLQELPRAMLQERT